MLDTTSFADIPKWEGIYAFYDGDPNTVACAYVGESSNLNARIRQHLVLRNSSVTTGSAAVGLRADLIRYAQWWEHEDFTDKTTRLGAELVAFEALGPTLRSRARVRPEAQALFDSTAFRERMTTLFYEPAGQLRVLGLVDLVNTVADLSERLRALEERVDTIAASQRV